MDTLEIIRLDISGKAIFAVIGDGDSLILIVEFHYYNCWAENFYLRDFMVRIGIDDQCRFNEITLGQRSTTAVAAKQESSSIIGFGTLEHPGNPIDSRFVYHGANHDGRVHRIADFKLRDDRL